MAAGPRAVLLVCICGGSGTEHEQLVHGDDMCNVVLLMFYDCPSWVVFSTVQDLWMGRVGT